jgi:nucleoside-diphosphate kinase
MPEQTLFMIKPDAVSRNLIGEIIRRIESAGYRIKDIKMIKFDRKKAERFYQVHRNEPFFQPLIDYMISGSSVPMILEGSGVIQGVRALIGSTSPADAAEGTIRKDFALDGRRNSVHASDSPETAAREIAFFFNHSL